MLEAVGEGKTIMAVAESEDRCNSLKFYDLCAKLEEVEKTVKASKKFEIIFNAALLSYLEGQRLVTPLIDERKTYGLKHTTVAKIYVSSLGMSTKTPDALRLIQFANPAVNKETCSDFGLTLEKILQNRIGSGHSTKTLGEVNALLDDLVAAAGTDAKTAIFRSCIIEQFNAMEQKWLMRIILNSMKIGLGHEVILNKFGDNVLVKYNECSNLRKVCAELGLGEGTAGVSLLCKFNPMLAKGFQNASTEQISEVEKAMKSDAFVMDVKLDGERMLLHKKGNQYRVYTRNGTDYSDKYSFLAEDVLGKIKHEDCVLDGEVCGWDHGAECIMRFGTNADMASEEKAGKGPRLLYFVFDILYLDGTTAAQCVRDAFAVCNASDYLVGRTDDDIVGQTCRLPLAIRRKILEASISIVPHRFEIVEHRIVLDSDISKRQKAIEVFFDEIVLAGGEGLVVKKLRSPYLFGDKSRSFAHWVKMKPEYGDQTQNHDFVIIGAWRSRNGSFNRFLLGARCEGTEEYVTIARVSSGFTSDNLRELRALLSPTALSWDPRHLPASLAAIRGKELPHVYIPPNKSVIVEVKCSQLVISSNYTSGLTCRFPRVVRIRFDKPVTDAVTLQDLKEIMTRPCSAVSVLVAKDRKKARGADEGDSHGGGAKRRRIWTAAGGTCSIFLLPDVDVAVEGSLFESMLFHVDLHYMDPWAIREGLNTEQIQVMILSQRGFDSKNKSNVLANPTEGDYIVSSTTMSGQVLNLIGTKKYNVIHYSYILRCIEAGMLIALKPCYYLGMSEAMSQTLSGKVDIFGNCYDEDIADLLELKLILASVERQQKEVIAKDRGESGDVSLGRKKGFRLKMAATPIVVLSPPDESSIVEVETAKPRVQYPDGTFVLRDPVGTELINMSWREIARDFFTEKEAESLLHDQNILWACNVTVYFDMYDNFGGFDAPASLQAPAVTHASSSSPAGAVPSLAPAPVSPHTRQVLGALCLLLLLHGGNVSTSLHVGVTHIVVLQSDLLQRAAALKFRLKALHQFGAHVCAKQVVTPEWIYHCIKQGHIITAPLPEHIVDLDPLTDLNDYNV